MLPIEQKIEEIITPSMEDMGYNLVRVKFGDGKFKILQIMAESKDNGNFGIDDCTKISRAVSAILDVEDIIRDKYNLEVTSPGIDRPLIKLRDYMNNIGKNAKITLKMPIDNRKRFTAEIIEVSGDNIKIRTIEPVEEVNINFTDIESGKLAVSEGIFKKKK